MTEPDSRQIEDLVTGHAGTVFTSIVTWAETLSVLARCQREGRLLPADHRAQKKAFLADWNGIHVVEAIQPVLGPAEYLIEKHALRGFEAVQLCSALWVGRPGFASFDERLRRPARREGLEVVP